MKIYQVGGSIRDALLGLPVQDRDWVVVGATPEALLAQGFLPVGKDFPVFLHPDTREEYALARTERKTAQGYRGFAVHAAPGVTLEEDLARRDLTINAIAQDDRGRLIDPFGGQADLQARVLRHVTPAFTEDPVRILRLARFAARFVDFSVAPETQRLMAEMVQAGEVDALVPERVWQELSRGLMAAQPSRMFEVLRACGALARLLPELDRLWGAPPQPGRPLEPPPEQDAGAHRMRVLDLAAQLQAPLPVRFACLMHPLGPGRTPAPPQTGQPGHEAGSAGLLQGVCERLRVPLACSELAEVLAREIDPIHQSGALGPQAVLSLLERCDALRKSARFDDLLLACECDARGRWGLQQPYPQRDRLRDALARVLAVPTAEVAARAQAQGLGGADIGAQVRQARLAALQAALPAG